MTRYLFKKSERLTGKKNIETLFSHGKNFRIDPFKIFWYTVEPVKQKPNIRLLFSVPKKIHKTSTKRNLIKRRMKESYRLNKPPFVRLLSQNNIFIHIGIIYSSSEILSFQTIEEKMILTLQQLIRDLKIESKEKNSKEP